MTAIEKTTQVLKNHPQAAKAGRFLWHLVQMVLAMEVGMIIYHMFIQRLLAPTGFSTLTRTYPLVGYWMMVISMVLGMIALMSYHRSTWRYSMGMTAAMLAPLAALTVLVLCDLFPVHSLYGIGDLLMILAMAAYMLFRPAHHTHIVSDPSCHAA